MRGRVGNLNSTGEFAYPRFDWRISHLIGEFYIFPDRRALGLGSPHRGFRVENLNIGVLTGEFEFDWRKCDI